MLISVCYAAGDEAGGLNQAAAVLLMDNYQYFNVTGFISSLIRIYNIGIISVLTIAAIGSLSYLGALAASEGKGIGRKISTWVAIRTLVGFTLLVPLGPSSMSGAQHVVIAIVNSSIEATEFMATQLAGSPKTLSPITDHVPEEVKPDEIANVYVSVVQMALCNMIQNKADPYMVKYDSDNKAFYFSPASTDVKKCGHIKSKESFASKGVLENIYEDVLSWYKVANSAIELQKAKDKAEAAEKAGVAVSPKKLLEVTKSVTTVCADEKAKSCKPLNEVFKIKNAIDLVEHFSTDAPVQPATDNTEYGWIEKILDRDHLMASLLSSEKVEFDSNIVSVPSLERDIDFSIDNINANSISGLTALISKKIPEVKGTLLTSQSLTSPKFDGLMQSNWLYEDEKTQIDPANVSIDVNLLPKAINVLAKGVIQDLKRLIESKNPVMATSKVGLNIIQKVETYWNVSTKDLAEQNSQLGKVQYAMQQASQAAAYGAYAAAKFGLKPGGAWHTPAYIAIAVFDNLFTMLNILVDIDYANLFKWEPLGAALSTLFFIWGAFYGVLLPVVPSLIVIFALIGWLLLIVEAILASPLIALGLAHPSGQQFFGASEQSSMLLLMLFLRPMLIFVGVIVSIAISHCGLTMLNYAIEVFILDLITGTSWWIDGVMLLMLMVIYGYIAFLVLVQSYTVIGMLPDKVSAWIGSGPLGGDSPLQQILAVRAGVESAAQKAAQGAGASVSDKGSANMQMNVAELAELDDKRTEDKDLIKDLEDSKEDFHTQLTDKAIDDLGLKDLEKSGKVPDRIKVLTKQDIEEARANGTLKLSQSKIDDMFKGKDKLYFVKETGFKSLAETQEDYRNQYAHSTQVITSAPASIGIFAEHFYNKHMKQLAVSRVNRAKQKYQFNLSDYLKDVE